MVSRPRVPRYSLIFPNIFGFKGGIQVYSATLLQALQQLYPQAEYDVFLKYDREVLPHFEFLPQTRFHYFGQFPRFLQTLLLALKILFSALSQRPDLMICTHINYSVVCLILKRLFRIPYWVVAHGLEVWDLQSPLLKLALRHADQVVSVSQYTRSRLLEEQKLSPAQIPVLPNTFDPNRFQITGKPEYLLQRYGLSPDQPVILSVTRLGRSARYKGYGVLLEALVLIRQSIPNVHYILVGKGDDRDWIETRIEQLNLSDCVTLTGFIPDSELSDHYNLCDVFALPSYGEGFGIVYLEALACGKPVLAGDRDGAVDPLDGGRLGCLVPPDAVEVIAQRLVEILQGTYPNCNIYHPHFLRQEICDRYQFDKFVEILAKLTPYQHIPPSKIMVSTQKN